jgi:nitrogenase molybdenum-iron protein alpha/beta subunit
MREVAYCRECGARLNLYLVGVCTRCHYDLTGEDPDRDAREGRARDALGVPDSPSERTER